MSLKRTDLAKNLNLKIASQMKQTGTPGRFGVASAALPDRREQRKLDQAAGLVPFAVKLHEDLVKQLQAQAVQEGVSLNELADRVMRAGLAAAPAPQKAAAKKVAAKKVAAKKAAKG